MLYKVRIITDDDNIIQLRPDVDSQLKGAKNFTVKATKDVIKRFLIRTKPGDSTSFPKSKRFVKYNDMIDFILNGNNDWFWFQSYRYPKTEAEFQAYLGGNR